MTTRSYAFFFNADHESLDMFYGPQCNEQVVRALEGLDTLPRTRILRGDLLPYTLATELVSVKAEPKGSTRSISRKIRYDMDLYKLAVCEFCDSLRNRWCTTDEQAFLISVAQNRVWTLVLPTLTHDETVQIDGQVKGFVPYLGACEIDRGNPLQMKLFDLIDGTFFSDGKIFQIAESGEESEDMGIAKSYRSTKRPVLLKPSDFYEQAPPALQRTEISERGKLSQQRISGKTGLTHHQRVAAALFDHLLNSEDSGVVSFDVKTDGGPSFVCEEVKLRKYLLNRTHPDGGPKARFFGDVLGIEEPDWRYLSDQIIQGMQHGALYRLKNTEHGISHGAFVTITGRNGRTAVIQTGWQVKSGEPARLVTAYPEPNYEGKPITPGAINVVARDLVGEAKWAAIYEKAHAAGRLAASNCVPTPMTLKGYAPIFAGVCGFAWVTIPDARSPIARWCKTNGIGHKNYKAGWCISPKLDREDLPFGDFQSLEPKEAYAKAFAEVLRANGIECGVESRLD